MTLNFVEELVLDWFNLCKNPWKEGGISISDYPTPKPEGKKGGGHGGDIDILSIGKEAIWIAEVETFNGTMKAEKKAEILLRKFREKNNFIKQNFNYLLTEKKKK